MFRPPVATYSNPYEAAIMQQICKRIMDEYEKKYPPGGKLHIQQELEDLLAEHEAMGGGVDGLCKGCDANGEHAADHFVEVLVKTYGLGWKRVSSNG